MFYTSFVLNKGTFVCSNKIFAHSLRNSQTFGIVHDFICIDWLIINHCITHAFNIGTKSSEKFKDFRILVWALHGITATGTSLDEAFGLIETVEKAAEIYMKISGKQTREGIDKKMLMSIATVFGLEVKKRLA